MLFAEAAFEDVWLWVILWKVMLIGTVGGFACMAIWVTIGGAADIKRLFARITADHEREEQQQRESE
ncbi:MAG: hypothetical protein U9N87_05760 [Planctomycetota bacterium]|nr:hypothetical protein [Planctomycetota bacterium]